ncbi:DUF6240 domain-containing protein [Alkaliphilus crotonatoxidans]
MYHGIQKPYYTGVNQAYSKQMNSFKIRGTLVFKNGTDIKLDVGDQKILSISLKGELNAKLGDTVVIDKKNILHSRVEDTTAAPILPEEEGKYSQLLKNMELPQRNDLMEALKTLDLHGIQLSKDTLLNFVSLKGQLNTLVEGLDYDTAIQIMDQEVDIDKEPLEKVNQAVEEAKQEEGGFSIAKIIAKFKSISTEEAEKIAEKIFGSKMGKDITDIIKALHRAGMDITRKNINRVNEVFTKLHQAKEISSEGMIEALKENPEANIDQLYRIKNSIKRGVIAVEEKVSQLAARAYDQFQSKGQPVTNKELERMEGDIKELLVREDLEVTDERVQLAKEMIKGGIDVSKDYIEKIEALKGQLKELAEKLSHEKITHLLKSGTDVEKTKIADLIKMVRELDNLENSQLTAANLQMDSAKIEDILGKLERTGEIQDKDLLLLLNRNIDLKLSDIERILFGEARQSIDEGYGPTIKMINLLNDIKTVNFNNIAQHLSQNQPITLESLAMNQGNQTNPIALRLSQFQMKAAGLSSENPGHVELAQAIVSNEMDLNEGNVRRVIDIQGKLQFIRTNMTSLLLQKGLQQGLQFEKMDIGQLMAHMNQFRKNHVSAQTLVDQLPKINQGGSDLLAMMLKNQIPPNLKELQALSSFIHNKQQLGHQLGEIIQLLEQADGQPYVREVNDLKQMIKDLSQGLREGKINLEEFEKQLVKEMGKLTEKLESNGHANREAVSKEIDKMLQSVQTQNSLNHRDVMLQFPFIMDNQLKNLQIYVMNEKRGSKKIDPSNMSILLNMDTNNLGNVNVYVGVAQRQITLKVGVALKAYKEMIEARASEIKGLLEEIGYGVKELTFRVEEEVNLLTTIDGAEEKQTGARHFIDMMI